VLWEALEIGGPKELVSSKPAKSPFKLYLPYPLVLRHRMSSPNSADWRDRSRTPRDRHSLVARGGKLALGSTVYDPTNPMGKMLVSLITCLS
jgi:hypothetical protein